MFFHKRSPWWFLPLLHSAHHTSINFRSNNSSLVTVQKWGCVQVCRGIDPKSSTHPAISTGYGEAQSLAVGSGCAIVQASTVVVDIIHIFLIGKYSKIQARFCLCGHPVLLCSLLHVQEDTKSWSDLIAVEKLLWRWQHSPKSPLGSYGVGCQPEDPFDVGEHTWGMVLVAGIWDEKWMDCWVLEEASASHEPQYWDTWPGFLTAAVSSESSAEGMTCTSASRSLGKPMLRHLVLLPFEKEFCWLCFREQKSSAFFITIPLLFWTCLMWARTHEHQPKDPKVNSLGHHFSWQDN